MRELSLNVLDIAQNSVSANATLIEIELTESTDKNELLIGIYDNGKGMTSEQLEAVPQERSEWEFPFSKWLRK